MHPMALSDLLALFLRVFRAAPGKERLGELDRAVEDLLDAVKAMRGPGGDTSELAPTCAALSKLLLAAAVTRFLSSAEQGCGAFCGCLRSGEIMPPVRTGLSGAGRGGRGAGALGAAGALCSLAAGKARFPWSRPRGPPNPHPPINPPCPLLTPTHRHRHPTGQQRLRCRPADHRAG